MWGTKRTKEIRETSGGLDARNARVCASTSPPAESPETRANERKTSRDTGSGAGRRRESFGRSDGAVERAGERRASVRKQRNFALLLTAAFHCHRVKFAGCFRNGGRSPSARPKAIGQDRLAERENTSAVFLVSTFLPSGRVSSGRLKAGRPNDLSPRSSLVLPRGPATGTPDGHSGAAINGKQCTPHTKSIRRPQIKNKWNQWANFVFVVANCLRLIGDCKHTPFFSSAIAFHPPHTSTAKVGSWC